MFGNQLVRTRNINQAAFLTAFGSPLIEIQDVYPNNTFVVSAPSVLLWYEKHLGWIPYRKYCNQRIRLKERGRSKAKLPKHFTGKKEGFVFEDIAKVRSWNKKEKEKYAPSSGVDNSNTNEL